MQWYKRIWTNRRERQDYKICLHQGKKAIKTLLEVCHSSFWGEQNSNMWIVCITMPLGLRHTLHFWVQPSNQLRSNSAFLSSQKHWYTLILLQKSTMELQSQHMLSSFFFVVLLFVFFFKLCQDAINILSGEGGREEVRILYRCYSIEFLWHFFFFFF